MRERIGNRALKKFLRSDSERCVRRKVRVERLEGRVKPTHLVSPLERIALLVVPASLRHAECPIEEISHVSQELERRARAIPRLKVAESRRRIALRFCRPVRDR